VLEVLALIVADAEPGSALWELARFVATALGIYLLCMFIWALLGWLPMVAPGLAFNDVIMSIRKFLDSIILPYVKLFGFIKPVQVGSMLLDLSFIVAFFVLYIAQKFIPPAIISLG
jgi:uncharacterized protein YggT (Ycf19 family)